ncbi:unnamed protein product, partial [marine sediment metagenome]
TMQKDIEALGGEPKKIPVKKKEEVRISEKVVIPEKKEIPVMEKKEIPAVQPILEKEEIPEEAPKEIPVEEKILERLLQAIESRFPPRGITAKIAELNGRANQYFRSTPKAILVSIVAMIIILLLVGGVSFGNLDKATTAIYQFFKDAQTLQGSR